ncbi:MAG: regulatory protein RecX [Lentisphaerota bacterium]
MSTVEIEKIEKNKSLFQISLSSGDSFLFLPDIVYGRSLKEGGSYERSYLDSLREDNDELLCFDALLRILRIRLHSTAELKKKLSLKKFKNSIIEKAILKAMETGLTNDNVSAQSYKNELVAKGYGSLRIKESFRRKGFPKEIIEDLISEDSKESYNERENARKLFDKKLSFLQRDKSLQKQKLKEKIFRFMQGKGYSNDIIFSLMKDFKE